jgi:hypothetical protein
MSLLLDDYPLVVLPRLAEKIGLNEALFLQQVQYWLNNSNKVIDNQKWIYNSFENWQKQFPFWSIRTLKRIVKKLTDDDFLITNQLDQNRFNRTNWYSINYDKIAQINDSDKMAQSKKKQQESAKLTQQESANLTQQESAKLALSKQRLPSTTKKTNALSDKKSLENISFEDWYKNYPRKRGKDRAKLLFKKLKKDELEILIEATKLYSEEVKDREPIHIAQSDTFLSQKRFEDFRADIEEKKETENKSKILKEKTSSLIQKIFLFAKAREKTPMKMREFKTNEGAAVFDEFEIAVLGYVGVNESIFTMEEDELYDMLVGSVSFLMDKKININKNEKEKIAC